MKKKITFFKDFLFQPTVKANNAFGITANDNIQSTNTYKRNISAQGSIFTSSKLVFECHEDSLRKLNNFYGFNWKHQFYWQNLNFLSKKRNFCLKHLFSKKPTIFSLFRFNEFRSKCFWIMQMNKRLFLLEIFG